MELTCFLCNARILANDGTKKLSTHLRWVHGILSSSERKLVCSQNGCYKTFTLLNSYLKHSRRFHLSELNDRNPNNEAVNEVDQDILVVDSDSESDQDLEEQNDDNCEMEFLKALYSPLCSSTYT